MRIRALPLLAALAMMLGMASPALAVQFGEPDTNPERYQGVALIVFFVGGQPSHLCTGTLIDRDSVLTAAHCTDGTSGALVGFDQHYGSFGGFLGATPSPIPGSTHTHPDWATQGIDLGVVNLAVAAPAGIPTWPLADAGTLDALKNKKGLLGVSAEIAGYGSQDELPPLFEFFWARYRGNVKITNVHSPGLNGLFNTVQVSANPGKAHSGGLCFGDSGGPILYKGEIVAVNSFVLNLQCMGNGFAQRTDNTRDLDWISDTAGM